MFSTFPKKWVKSCHSLTLDKCDRTNRHHCQRKVENRAGEKTHRLKALAAFPEDLLDSQWNALTVTGNRNNLTWALYDGPTALRTQPGWREQIYNERRDDDLCCDPQQDVLERRHGGHTDPRSGPPSSHFPALTSFSTKDSLSHLSWKGQLDREHYVSYTSVAQRQPI